MVLKTLNNRRKEFLILLLFIFAFYANAQDDLLESLESEQPKKKEFVLATFKGTRLINQHTVETLGAGSLDVRIAHRFGDFSSGAYNLWGLDGPATIRLGFDYAITDRLMVGVGRTNYNKMFDGFIKYRILRQTTDNSMPVSVTWLSTGNIIGLKDPIKYQYFTSRLVFMHQVMIARKFSERLSLQVAPTYIHYNLVQALTDKNDMFATALSGRFKITRSVAITAEYVVRVSNYGLNDFQNYHNSAGVGFDIETGGHVFQVFVTNSYAINPVQVIPYTSSSWGKGNVRLGFNISRVFSLKRKKSW